VYGRAGPRYAFPRVAVRGRGRAGSAALSQQLDPQGPHAQAVALLAACPIGWTSAAPSAVLCCRQGRLEAVAQGWAKQPWDQTRLRLLLSLLFLGCCYRTVFTAAVEAVVAFKGVLLQQAPLSQRNENHSRLTRLICCYTVAQPLGLRCTPPPAVSVMPAASC
jgi:hypothetical protein